MQYAITRCSMQLATHRMQLATYRMHLATYRMHHATHRMHHATYRMHHATYRMPLAHNHTAGAAPIQQPMQCTLCGRSIPRRPLS